MKRALALTVMLASAAAMGGQALAAGTVNQYGSVKLQWNVAVAMNAVIHTNYTAAFAYGGATGTIGSAGTGTCGTEANTADLNMNWGTITPPFGAFQSCDYQNAVGVSVQTNDSNGFAVNEYLDTALPSGTYLCAYANSAAGTFPMTPAATISTTQYATAPAVMATAGTCTGNGKNITNAGTIQNAGQGPVTTPALAPAAGEYASGAAGIGQGFISATSTTGAAELAGEDLQLSVNGSAASGNNLSDIMTLQFVAN